MEKKENDIRDIYQAEERDLEKDLNPQPSQDAIKTLQQTQRRQQIISIVSGVLPIVLFIALISVALLDFSGELRLFRNPANDASADKPQLELFENSLWIMEYPANKKTPDETPGAKPLSAQWVKTAAYYTIAGQKALAFNRYEESLSDFKKAVEFYPDIKGIHATIGVLHLFLKEYSNAVQHLETALQEEETFETVNNLGNAYVGTKQYDLAEKNLKKALELAPENSNCHKNMADLYQKMERDNNAVFHFEKYLDMEPDDLEFKQAFALYLIKLGRWKNAEEVLSELTQLANDNAPLYFLLAQAQLQNGRLDKATDTLRQGSQQIDPKLALTWLLRDEFNAVRNTPGFKQLTDQLNRSAE